MSKKKIELEVEGLRGLAALMVLYTHLLAPTHDVDPGYQPPPFWYAFECGQGAVLVFFVLSGYVIGLTNTKAYSAGSGRQYVLRRGVRLVPLCWLAVGLSVLALPGDGWRAVLGNLFFLQNSLPYGPLHIPLLMANTNLWSLNYEVLYYLLFLGLWAGRIGPWRPLLGSGIIVLLGMTVPAFPAVITNYAAGWMFWLSGYWLSRTPQASHDDVRWPWPSLLLFALAAWKVKPLFFLTRRFGALPPSEGWVNITFVDFIPVCAALMMIMALRRPKGAWLLVYAAAAVPTAFMVWRIIRGRAFADELALYDGVVIAGLALWWWRPSLGFFRLVAPVGAISYGIYVFQRPAQWFIAYADWLPGGGIPTFLLRAGIITLLTLALAWLAERKLQPLIRDFILRRT